jgi:hypothetical protein
MYIYSATSATARRNQPLQGDADQLQLKRCNMPMAALPTLVTYTQSYAFLPMEARCTISSQEGCRTEPPREGAGAWL